jgi:hypothetical protein
MRRPQPRIGFDFVQKPRSAAKRVTVWQSGAPRRADGQQMPAVPSRPSDDVQTEWGGKRATWSGCTALGGNTDKHRPL